MRKCCAGPKENKEKKTLLSTTRGFYYLTHLNFQLIRVFFLCLTPAKPEKRYFLKIVREKKRVPFFLPFCGGVLSDEKREVEKEEDTFHWRVPFLSFVCRFLPFLFFLFLVHFFLSLWFLRDFWSLYGGSFIRAWRRKTNSCCCCLH